MPAGLPAPATARRTPMVDSIEDERKRPLPVETAMRFDARPGGACRNRRCVTEAGIATDVGAAPRLIPKCEPPSSASASAVPSGTAYATPWAALAGIQDPPCPRHSLVAFRAVSPPPFSA